MAFFGRLLFVAKGSLRAKADVMQWTPGPKGAVIQHASFRKPSQPLKLKSALRSDNASTFSECL
ncbi:hypothetical protein B9K09_13775 [Pseudomonas sp. M30-35]|nr:hypothetical protein B9K09_13775 [Pseudomonas sp. M30-35]